MRKFYFPQLKKGKPSCAHATASPTFDKLLQVNRLDKKAVEKLRQQIRNEQVLTERVGGCWSSWVFNKKSHHNGYRGGLANGRQ